MSDPKLPSVDDAYVRRIFDALEKMDVQLDADPILYGPKRLNAKVALCRQHLSRCQQIYLQVSNDLHHLNRALRQAKVEFDLQMQDLFANDPDVRSGKNVRDREAIATMKLRAEREAIQQIESSVQDLESVMTVVKGRREDLKDVQGRIRDQVKLCQEELNLGSKWGSSLPPGAKPVDLDARPKVDPTALEAMNDLMRGIDGESSVSDLDAFVKSELAARGEKDEDDEEAEEETASTDLDALIGEVSEADPAPEVNVLVTLEELKATPAPLPEPVVAVDPLEDLEQTLSQATPEPEPTPEQVEAEDASLPEVEAKPDPTSAETASSSEIDDFFNGLELDAPKQGPGRAAAQGSAPPPVSDDIDLDDLIGSFK